MKRLVYVLLSILTISGCNKKFKEPLQGVRESVLLDNPAIRVDLPDQKIVLPLPVINSEWAMPGGVSSHAMVLASLQADLKQIWRTSLSSGFSSDNRLLNGPIIADNKIFAIDNQGTISAVDLDTGRIIWQVSTLLEDKSAHPFGGGLAYEQGVVFAVSAAAEVLAINSESGNMIWRQPITAPVRSAPVVNEGQIYTININNQLEVFKASNGRPLWSHAGTIEPACILGGASPAVYGNLVVAPYTSGEIFALRTENGHQLWSESLESVHSLDSVAAIAHIKARPVIYKNWVILISHGGKLSSIDLSKGSIVWTRNIAGIRSPTVVGGYIFLVTNNAQLLCVEHSKGQILWMKQLPQYIDEKNPTAKNLWAGPILTAQGLILTASSGQAIFCSPYNGEIIRTIDLRAATSLSPVVAKNTLLFFTDHAELIAYR